MPFARFLLALGALLIFGSKAKGDEVRVTAYAVFQEPNAGPNQQFIFSSTFLYDLDTNQLVAGSMSTQVTDTFAGTPYTNWLPKPNFHGPTFTYFDPGGRRPFGGCRAGTSDGNPAPLQLSAGRDLVRCQGQVLSGPSDRLMVQLGPVL
jgi:hypothetical protein